MKLGHSDLLSLSYGPKLTFPIVTIRKVVIALKGDCIEVAYTTLRRHLSADAWPKPCMHPKIKVIFNTM